MKPSPKGKFLFLSGILFLFFISALYWFFFVPPSNTASAKMIFIKKGTHLKKVSEILEQEGIIKNRHFFILLTTALGKKTKIKAGEYEFHTQMLPLDVLDALVKGQAKRHMVTIPEGYTLAQIAQLFEDSNLIEKKEFLQKATSPDLII